MKGISIIVVFTLFLILDFHPVSAQEEFCCGNCYDKFLVMYDNMGGAWRQYASDLRYIKGQREIHNAWGTAYAMDMTVSPGYLGTLQLEMQKDMAYATAIMNPANDDFNPSFISTYPFWSIFSGARLSCYDCCNAANAVGNINEPVSTVSQTYDYLGASCWVNDILKSNNFVDCAPVKKNVMLLAFYNSNNQWTGPWCNSFSPKIATNVADPTPSPNIPGFITKGLSGGIYTSYGPVYYMRKLMSSYCCKGRRASVEEPEQYIAATNTTDGFKEIFGKVVDLEGKRKPEPERDEEAEKMIMELREGSKEVLRKAMREAGIDDSILDE